ncbi:hypothetical protein GJAV_G00253310, partial [Gymnothorax javanicus]
DSVRLQLLFKCLSCLVSVIKFLPETFDFIFYFIYFLFLSLCLSLSLSLEGKVNVLLPVQELKTREDFLQYSSQLTLDSNTANEYLRLSEGNRKVTFCVGRIELYPDHPERFDSRAQVLCRE